MSSALLPAYGAGRFAPISLAAASALLVAACAGVQPAPAERAQVVVADAPFTIEGRLSARRDSQGLTANFRWTHAPPHDALAITTPLGQDVARIEGDAAARVVEIRMADGRQESASDWTALTDRTLGFALPVGGLAAWVRGGPYAGTPSSIEPDQAGRAEVLRQDGWEIVYGYGDATTRTPNRLRLTYASLEVRIVIDRWHD